MARLRPLAMALLLLAALAVTGCGQSDEEQAQQDVCAARDDLHHQVQDLAGLTASTATVQVVQEKLTAIRDDLKKIGDARTRLSEEQRQQVDNANKEFVSTLDTIVRDIGSSMTLSEAGTKLKAATQQLATTYEQTFAKIDCS
jgi:hypothetical protein